MRDTLYYSIGEDTIKFLGFFQNGIVKGISMHKGPYERAENIIESIALDISNSKNDYRYWSIGNYQFDGTKIKFELKSAFGTVLYAGQVFSSECLELNSHSLINDFKSKNTYHRYSEYPDIEINTSKVYIDVTEPFPCVVIPDNKKPSNLKKVEGEKKKEIFNEDSLIGAYIIVPLVAVFIFGMSVESEKAYFLWIPILILGYLFSRK
jgi:hypothetical protein